MKRLHAIGITAALVVVCGTGAAFVFHLKRRSFDEQAEQDS